MTLYPNPNPGRPPLGGKWRYTVDSITLSDESFSKLVDIVKTFLVSKLFTRVEVEQLVLAQEKLRCPWLVRENEETQTLPTHQIAFRDYARKLGSCEYLDADDIEKRSAVCLQCPQNVVCEVEEEAGRLLYLLSRGRDSKGLGWCAVHGHHNAIACQVDKKIEVKTSQPEACWVKLSHASP